MVIFFNASDKEMASLSKKFKDDAETTPFLPHSRISRDALGVASVVNTKSSSPQFFNITKKKTTAPSSVKTADIVQPQALIFAYGDDAEALRKKSENHLSTMVFLAVLKNKLFFQPKPMNFFIQYYSWGFYLAEKTTEGVHRFERSLWGPKVDV
jgi:hypothetical protein